MKLRQVVCPLGCWNAEADGVVAESERVSQPRFGLAGVLWRWTSLWLVSSVRTSLPNRDSKPDLVRKGISLSTSIYRQLAAGRWEEW